MLTNSRILFRLPMRVSARSPLYFRSCDATPTVEYGKKTLSSPMCVTPSTYTCAISRVRAPISTSAPMMQEGPISALVEIRASGSTIAAGWMAMRRLRDRHRLFSHRGAVLQYAHQLGFGDYHSVHRGLPVHLGDARLALGHLHLDTKLIARPHRTPELGLLDGRQQNQLVLAIPHLLEHQHAGHLRHRFHDQHSRHHRKLRKMAHEERFVHRNVLNADDSLLFQLQDGIHQKHRITMRQNVANLLDVE